MIYAISIVALALFATSLEASYTLKSGKLVSSDKVATLSVQEHHSAALQAFHSRNWEELFRQATIITVNFPGTPFSQESHYFLGRCYLEFGEYELANKNLTYYLKKQGAPKHFEQAMTDKLTIAEAFRKGAKKHLMGFETMPKWVSADEEALRIYDEIVTAMPNHALAAQALLGKGYLLDDVDEYKESIENLQTLIRKFPKHNLAAQAFLQIGKTYLKQVQKEFPDADLLDLAQINLRKFTADFPGDGRLEEARQDVREMQEFFAGNLYETAQFFERTKKPQASLIYYGRIVRDFPTTDVAMLARGRVAFLTPPTSIPTTKIAENDAIVNAEEHVQE